MSNWVIGVIGGSGLYEIDGLENAEPVSLTTPWGDPSDTLIKPASEVSARLAMAVLSIVRTLAVQLMVRKVRRALMKSARVKVKQQKPLPYAKSV